MPRRRRSPGPPWIAAGLGGLGSVALLGCHPPRPTPTVHPLAPCELRWPAPPKEQTRREGRHATGTVAFVKHDGLRYEAARFLRDESLSPQHRARLLGAVEQGLQARPGVGHSRRDGATLVVELSDGGRGRFWSFFVDDRTLLELSVVGDDAAAVDDAARWFFGAARCPATSSSR